LRRPNNARPQVAAANPHPPAGALIAGGRAAVLRFPRCPDSRGYRIAVQFVFFPTQGS